MSEVFRPHLPYRGPIYEGVHEGKRIKIEGHVPFGAEKFSVNLTSSMDKNSDRPLHINVKLKKNMVVRNSFQKNSYGTKETSSTIPFTLGGDFSLVIQVDTNEYKIFVNGQHCWDFTHRIPFGEARSIFIEGDIHIERIEYINKKTLFQRPPVTPPLKSGSISGSSGQLYPAICTPSSPPSVSVQTPLTCTFPIYGGIAPGMFIYISGLPTESPQKFTINVQSGTTTYPPPDIAFHFDVRFFDYSIVRNSRMNSVWSAEENVISHFPFQPRCNFNMIIMIQNDMYVVMLDDQPLLTFKHRLPDFSRFNIISIENDVIVTSIRYG